MYKIYVITDNGKQLKSTCKTPEERDEKIRLLISSSSERVFVEYEEVKEFTGDN